MAITILDQPDTFSAVRNPIPLRVRAAAGWQGNDSYEIWAEILKEVGYRSGVFESLDTLIGIPDPNKGNEVVFDFQSLLKSAVTCEPIFETSEDQPHICTKVNARYQIVLTEVVDQVAESPTNLAVKHAVNAGISKRKYGIGERLQYWQLTARFLTHQPREKRVTQAQPEWLYWPSSFAGDVRLQGEVSTDDGATVAIPVVNNIVGDVNDILRFPCGFDQLELYTLTGTVESWKVWVEKVSDSARLSEEMTFTLDHCDCPSIARYFVAKNSLGGYDTFFTAGESTSRVDIQKQSFQRILGPFYSGFDREYMSENITRSPNFTQALSYRNKLDYVWMTDLLASQDAWRLGDGFPNTTAQRSWYPIEIKAANFDFYEDNGQVQQLSFDYSDAQLHHGL